MKAQALAALLDALDHGGENVAVRKFISLLRDAPSSMTVQAAIERFKNGPTSAAPVAEGRASVGALRDSISRASIVVGLVGTKTSVEDCTLVAKFIAEAADVDLSAFESALARGRSSAATPRPRVAKPPNSGVIDFYVAKFQTASPGSDEYEENIQALRADTGKAKAREVRAIASALNVEAASGASRAALLKALERNHRIIFDTRAKAATLTGQSAT